MIDFNPWESSNIDDMLTLLVGKTYGQDPRAQLDLIQQTKYHEAQNIKKHLELSQTDRVIDLGSGCGFIADHLAPTVESLECADISQSFLDYTSRVTRHHNNVSCHLIPFADMSSLKMATAIYSMAVFIHFNLYDCYLYLEQCYNRLEPEGRMLFDILNDRHVDISSPRWKRHCSKYIQDRSATFTIIHYNNPTAIMVAACQIGFTIKKTYDERDQTFILLQKPR